MEILMVEQLVQSVDAFYKTPPNLKMTNKFLKCIRLRVRGCTPKKAAEISNSRLGRPASLYE